jgi:hypothetical protein
MHGITPPAPAPSPAPALRGCLGGAGVVCGLLAVAAVLLAALFYSSLIPGTTSGEAMLLLILGAVPLGLLGLVLSLVGRGAGRLRTLGITFALIAVLGGGGAVLWVVLAFYAACSSGGCF